MPRERALAYQVDARVWLGEERQRLKRPVMLDSIPASTLDAVADLGFRWLWLVGLWETSLASRGVSRRSALRLEEFREALPDLTLEDIVGSPHAVKEYRVSPELGGEEALEALRADLAQRDLRLLVDFVGNHVGLDHPWALGHPEFFIQGSEDDAARSPGAFWRVPGGHWLAHGAGPDSSPWPDTLQLNHRHSGLRAALWMEIEKVAAMADGIHCVNAALVSPDSISRTWGERAVPADGTPPARGPFWSEAISRIRAIHPRFVFACDAQSGQLAAQEEESCDYLSDAPLRDALQLEDASLVRRCLSGQMGGGNRWLRSLESYGGARAAQAFRPEVLPAAALIEYMAPGLGAFQDGQIDGRRKGHNMHLSRRPEEPGDRELRGFHEALLEVLRRPEVDLGQWELLEARPAWEGNSTWESFIIGLHRGSSRELLLSAVNFGPKQAQCFVDLSCLDPAGREWAFQDLLSVAMYVRDGADLAARGLYLDLPPWDYNVFEVTPARAA
jgi:hypothetical protein